MEGLPTTTKSDRRGRSKSLQTSKPSLLLAFFSCVAGRSPAPTIRTIIRLYIPDATRRAEIIDSLPQGHN